MRRLRAKVAQIERATRDITRLQLAPNDEPFLFEAGQYARLTFGGRFTWPYAMANRPGAAMLEFHIPYVLSGATSRWVAKGLKVGATVYLEGPYGTAYLRPRSARPLLLIAGGAGLAAIKSILLTTLAWGDKREIHVYHGVRDVRDLYDGNAIRMALASRPFHFTAVVSTPSREATHRIGLVHEAVTSDFASLEGFDVHMAGPPSMVEVVTAVVLKLGARRENVHAEALDAPPPAGRQTRAAWVGRFVALFTRRETPELEAEPQQLDGERQKLEAKPQKPKDEPEKLEAMEVLEMDGSTAGAGKDAIPRRTADGSQVLQLVREILEENERLKAQVESSEAIQRECNELRTALDDAVRILVNVRDTLERHQAEARRSGSGRSEERQNASVLTTRKS